MSAIPKPVVRSRSWVYEYSRPRRMGWPLLDRTGWPEAGYEDEAITPHKFTIVVRQPGGGLPQLDSISVTGIWTGSGRTLRRQKVYHDAKPEQRLIIHAPDWVLDLARDAVSRSLREVSRAGSEVL